jgi:hypothetical protein
VTRKKRLRREATQRWRSKPDVQSREKKDAVRNTPLRAARRAVGQMRLQAGRTYAALQNALSGPEPTNMAEASQQVVAQAEAKVEAAALQLRIMQQLATPGFIRLESVEMGAIMESVRGSCLLRHNSVLAGTRPSTLWQRVFRRSWT